MRFSRLYRKELVHGSFCIIIPIYHSHKMDILLKKEKPKNIWEKLGDLSHTELPLDIFKRKTANK